MNNYRWIFSFVFLLFSGAAAAAAQPDANDFLVRIINPNVAYLLLMIGIYGILTELSHPGLVIPGLVGVIALALAGYSMSFLPVNYVGLALLILGIVSMLSEVHFTSYGILGVTGFVGYIAGSLLLYQSDDPNLQLSMTIVFMMSFLTAVFIVILITVILRAHQRPVVTGQEALLHSKGVVRSIHHDKIQVLITGEIWQARSKSALTKGQHVKVVKADGLYLEVEPTDKEQ